MQQTNAMDYSGRARGRLKIGRRLQACPTSESIDMDEQGLFCRRFGSNWITDLIPRFDRLTRLFGCAREAD